MIQAYQFEIVQT